MDGLLLRLEATGPDEPRFWKLFGPIRQHLDRLYWRFEGQPWMGAPDGFDDDDVELFGPHHAQVDFWRPGALGRYGDHINEEFIHMWAIEPTRDDPARVAARYAACGWGREDPVIAEHARVRLIYTDSTCWEAYARKPTLLDRLAAGLDGKSWVAVTRGRYERRGELFGNAGLSKVWRAIRGRPV